MVVYTGNFIMVYYEDVERWLMNDTPNTPTKNEDQMIEEQRTLKDYR